MRIVTNTFIIVFLAVQVSIPIRGFVLDKSETRARFSWNMYAKVHQVKASYLYRTADGEQVKFNYKDYFNNPDRATMVHQRDTLPVFHAYLCETLKAEDDRIELYGKVIYRINGGESIELVAYGDDLCAAPNYGVKPP